ncbi:hypothetical protein ZWY2020_018419 [Hordeum vulgare]|nr:hypothetical protein ZWY2020_018419 [Hordeum vulgare]
MPAAAAGVEWVLPEEANATPAIPAVVGDGSGRERPTLITGAMVVLAAATGERPDCWGWTEELGAGGGGPSDRLIPVVSSPRSYSGRPIQVVTAAGGRVVLFSANEGERMI